MQGQLFSTDFLLRGIQETEAWKGVPDAELDAFIGQLRTHFAPFTADSAFNESQTEDELIEPVIDLLGGDYILSTFPIVRERDMKAHGTFRTRDLIMGYLARTRAGS